MSRFNFDGEEWFPNQGWLWEQSLTNAVNSKRGQQVLKDLEAALLEMPEKKLIANRIASPEGDVCAVGALHLYRRTKAGEDRAAVLSEIATPDPDLADVWRDADDELRTMDIGEQVGVARTLAWEIGFLNDETLHKMTPGARYDAVLKWTRERILA